METVRCAICHSDRYKKIMTSMDIWVSKERFDIVKCQDCGFIFTNPRPAFAEIARYYGAEYYAYQKPATTYRQTLTNGMRFLDYGCGAGDYMISKMNLGYEAYGVDIDGTAIGIARECGLNVKQAQPRNIDFGDDFFDEIRLNHVLEHIHELRSIVAELYRCLKPGGMLTLEVPNIASFDAKINREAWRGLEVPRHLYHFSPDSCLSLLRAHGFGEIKCKTYNHPVVNRQLYYLRGCYTSMKIAYHLRSGFPFWRLLRAVLTGVFNISRYSLHHKTENDGWLLSVCATK
jgi:SAM-dependent methyltransferase